MTTEKNESLDLILPSRADELLLARKEGAAALQKRLIEQKRELQIQNKRENEQKRLLEMKDKFTQLLYSLSEDQLIDLDSLTAKERMALPDFIAKKAVAPAIIQGVAALIGPAMLINGLIVAPLHVLGVIACSAIMSVAALMIFESFDNPKLYNFISKLYKLNSLRFLYYYRRIRKELGVENYFKFLTSESYTDDW